MKYTLELDDIVKLKANEHGLKIVAKYIQYDLTAADGSTIRLDVSGMEYLQNSGLFAILDLIDSRIKNLKGA